MLSGHRPAPRRRGHGRAKRIAAPLAVPMALGLTLGIMLAVSGGNTTHVDQSSLRVSATPSASASACPTAAWAARTPTSPTPSWSSSTATARPCRPPSNTTRQRATATNGPAG